MTTDTITGYQWGEGNRYIGPYQFPNNADKNEIHLPPRTTLKAPPAEVPAGKILTWDAGRDSWILMDAPPEAAPIAAQAPSPAPAEVSHEG